MNCKPLDRIQKEVNPQVARLIKLRQSDGKLPAYAWPGGYPLLYLDYENSALCSSCATESMKDIVPQFRPVAYDIYYEGPTLFCDQCNEEIESAYEDPNDIK